MLRNNSFIKTNVENIDQLAQQAIIYLQQAIADMGFNAHIHFELEGCYRFADAGKNTRLDLARVNQALERLNIDGEVVHEYWQNQWEYVSRFNGQSPLTEAKNLVKAIRVLPKLFAQQGVIETLIQPVVWSGDNAQLALGSKNIFTGGQRTIHIPNAIQLNISVSDEQGKNLVAKSYFGEFLQQSLIDTSLACSLLYLPDTQAFARFQLKSRYGLQEELCSPVDISGGHQGSVALYRQYGKHNQPMGEQPLVVNRSNEAILSSQNWHKTARIEHRLGAASTEYNPYLNVVYALLNVFQATEAYKKGLCQQKVESSSSSCQLPTSLWPNENDQGAVALFNESLWFEQVLNQVQILVEGECSRTDKQISLLLGTSLKASVLAKYTKQKIIINQQ